MTIVLSGQINVPAAGTAVPGPDVQGGTFILLAHPDNTGSCWIGNDGADDVTDANGFALVANVPITINTPNLNKYQFDADTNDNKICWLRLEP